LNVKYKRLVNPEKYINEDYKIKVGDVLFQNGIYYLVGDINELGGTCDCCTGFDCYSEFYVIVFENPNLDEILKFIENENKKGE